MESNFRQLTQDYEQGKDDGACKLLKAVHEAAFGDKISALNTIQETNEADRLAAPGLPEIKVTSETLTKNRYDKNDSTNKAICDFLTDKKGPCTENLQMLKIEGEDFSYKHTMNLRNGQEWSELGGGKNNFPKCEIW
jgi:hypothetical protein